MEAMFAHVARTGYHAVLASDWTTRHEILQRGLKINDDGYAYDLGDPA